MVPWNCLEPPIYLKCFWSGTGIYHINNGRYLYCLSGTINIIMIFLRTKVGRQAYMSEGLYINNTDVSQVNWLFETPVSLLRII